MMRQGWTAAGVAMSLAAGPLAAPAGAQAQPAKPAATFTADGKLVFPADYRTWVYLSSGMDMAYSDLPGLATMHVFDNVFVDRAAYAAFLKTGHWPEGTVMILEVRRGEGKTAINRKGQFQTGVMAREAHVKDKRYASGWAFFSFAGEAAAGPHPQTSDCNQCHEQHAAVDTTFVQFYPTLMPVAKAMNTFSPAWLAEEKDTVK